MPSSPLLHTQKTCSTADLLFARELFTGGFGCCCFPFAPVSCLIGGVLLAGAVDFCALAAGAGADFVGAIEAAFVLERVLIVVDVRKQN